MQKNSHTPRFSSCRSATPDGNTHEIHWIEWGTESHEHVVICAHGLTRNGHDFDYLAKHLAKHCRLICPDYPGRGNSPKLANPEYYSIEQYVKDTFAICETLKYSKLDWIGVSMGGLIGMAIASMHNPPFSSMVINDVGAEIPRQSLNELAADLSCQPASFNSKDEVYEYFSISYAGYGKLEDHHYRHMADHGVWPALDGNGYVLARDSAIIEALAKVSSADLDLWDAWKRITIPTLIVRGKESSLLLPETVSKMLEIHPKASVVEFAGCGHAPSLMVDDQIATVAGWLGYGEQD